jgi:signal transduction histidine kinase
MAVFCSTVATIYADGPSSEELSNLGMVTLYTGIGLAAMLVMRRTRPVLVALTASAAAIVLPLDTFAALLSLTWVIASRRVRTSVLCGIAVVSATVVSLARDLAREPTERAWTTHDSVTGAVTFTPGAPWYWVGGVLLVGAAVGVGLARRFHLQAADSQEAQATAIAVLHDQVMRQDERELIAREVHDTVAHHLATMAMQASAFEVTHDDPAAKDAARQMRSSAQAANAELRNLLASLRTGDQTGVAGGHLEDLVALVDGVRAQGTVVSASIYVADAEEASDALSRATFRIVQESLTNAVKHAPGGSIELDVRVGRSAGGFVRAANPLPATPVTAPGTGSGLVAMAERARALGGDLQAGPDGDRFVVQVRRPWSERPVPGQGAHG